MLEAIVTRCIFIYVVRVLKFKAIRIKRYIHTHTHTHTHSERGRELLHRHNHTSLYKGGSMGGGPMSKYKTNNPTVTPNIALVKSVLVATFSARCSSSRI